MSFFSDLFEGNFGNLGTDITHAPSSLASHPDQLAETLGATALIGGGLFFAPEIGGALGLGGAEAAAGGGLAADLGIGDIGAAAAADSLGAGALGADVGADALAFAPESVDALSIAPGVGGDVLPESATLDTGALDFSNSTAATGGVDTGGGVADTTSASAIDPNDPANFGSGGKGAADAASGSSIFTAGNALKYGLAAAPLALALSRGEPSIPSQANPAIANATALAQQGANLNPSQNASLVQMRQNAINAARQALFNQGVQNPDADTRYSQMVANIDSQVTAASQTMIQQNIQNALAGDSQLIQIASLQMQQDTAFTNTLVNATAAFGRVAGGGTTINLKAA